MINRDDRPLSVAELEAIFDEVALEVEADRAAGRPPKADQLHKEILDSLHEQDRLDFLATIERLGRLFAKPAKHTNRAPDSSSRRRIKNAPKGGLPPRAAQIKQEEAHPKQRPGGVVCMNRKEKHILKTAIKAVRHHNSNAWWELKRQIFEGGYQPHYPAQLDFDQSAEQMIERQSESVKAVLINAWKTAKPPRAELSDSEILSSYARLIVAEIVARARVAASRTQNW